MNTMKRLSLFILFLSAAGLLAASSLYAASYTWNGGGADDNFSTGDNWGGSAPPSGSELVFAGSTRLTPYQDLDTNPTWTKITFDATAGAFDIDGNVFKMGGNVYNNSAATQTFDANIDLTGNYSFYAAYGDIVINGVIGESATGKGPTTSCVGGINWHMVTFTNANTFTGNTVVSGNSILRITNSGALGPGGYTQATSGQLQLDGSGGNLTLTEEIRYGGTTALEGPLYNIAGNNVLNGPTKMISSTRITVANGSSLTINGNIDSTGTYTYYYRKLGAGTLIVNGANLHSGGTRIEEGTFVAGHANALGSGGLTTFSSGATLEVAAGIALANPISITSGARLVANTGSSVTLNSGSSFRGWESTSTAPDAKLTVAKLIGGTTQAQRTISPSIWTNAIAGVTASDVLDLTGTATDTYVLQMSYDEASLGDMDETTLMLGWNNGSEWVNAITGNNYMFGGWSRLTPEIGPVPNFSSVFADDLGRWGIDLATNVAWAVLNHGSEMAVIGVPEPNMIILLFCGLIGLLAAYIRRRRR